MNPNDLAGSTTPEEVVVPEEIITTPEEVVVPEEEVIFTPSYKIFEGKQIISEGTRTVNDKKYNVIRLIDGSTYDLTDEEYSEKIS